MQREDSIECGNKLWKVKIMAVLNGKKNWEENGRLPVTHLLIVKKRKFHANTVAICKVFSEKDLPYL